MGLTRRRQRRGLFPSVLAIGISMVAFCAYGEDYMSRDEFLQVAFPDAEPTMEMLWLTKETRAAAEAAVGFAPRGLRQRYWQHDNRTAWILEEIGKEKPITLGVVIEAGRIDQLQVLAFRESRGWEIRYPFFTTQFSGVALREDGALSGIIDGITGATMSVNAAKRVARLALWLAMRLERQAHP